MIPQPMNALEITCGTQVICGLDVPGESVRLCDILGNGKLEFPGLTSEPEHPNR